MHGIVRRLYTVDHNTDDFIHVLDELVHVVGARHVWLTQVDEFRNVSANIRTSSLSELFGPNGRNWDKHMARFGETYQKTFVRSMAKGAETLYTPLDLCEDAQERAETQEWLADVHGLLGYSTYAGGVFAPDAAFVGFAGFGFSDDEGPRAAAFRRDQSFWLTHLSAAVAMHGRLQKATHAAALLERLKWGILLTTPDGRVIHKTEEAARVLTEKRPITVAAGRVTGPPWLARFFSGAADALSRPRSLLNFVEGPGGGTIVFAVRYSDDRRLFAHDTDGVALCVLDCAKDASRAIDIAREMFALSAAEAEVLSLAASGASRATIADQRNVSPETIKSQVRAIVTKSGATTLRDLTARLALFEPPFCDGASSD